MAKLLDHVFRQPSWKSFGEHLGEEEEGNQEWEEEDDDDDDDEEEEESSCGPL